MANEKNLKPMNKRTKSEQREIAKKGGKKSGEVRKAKKTIKSLLCDFLDSDIKKHAQFKALAAKMGVDGKKSVKYLITFMGLMNSIQKADLEELELLMRMLGEDTKNEGIGELERLIEGLKDE